MTDQETKKEGQEAKAEAAPKAPVAPPVKVTVTKEAAKEAVASVRSVASKAIAKKKPAKKKRVARKGAPKKATKKAAPKKKAPAKPAEKTSKKAVKAKPGRKPGRKGASLAKRDRIVKKFRALIEQGASRQDAAKKVKLADLTLRRWETAMGLKPASNRGMGVAKAAPKAAKKPGRKPGRPKGSKTKVVKAKPGRKPGPPKAVKKVKPVSAKGLRAKIIGKSKGLPSPLPPYRIHMPNGFVLECGSVDDLVAAVKVLK
ncbi:MAG TPA: hypothetical protein PK668_25565 [Myxococcota bacterium]|nr:hypothetical protein [Myxococcota bacterium]HRY96897.1 hypothetical protein [Myxococcota bacterium]